ncbi:sensor histidine kinase [Oscillatoria sp. FACHB-1407]|nr:HAMP domain-containing sensor histidine kinase [Oscillatoria sp. FACHB-1407]
MLRIKQQYNEIQSLSQLQQKTISLLEHHLQELNGNLISKLSHELKTPLTGILGAIGLLKREVNRINLNSETINDLLDILNRSSLRLETLTRKFLNYFYLELKTLERQREVGNYQFINSHCAHSTFIAECAMAIAQEMERSQDLDYRLEEIDLNISKQHLQWIAEELVENAFKFSHPQTPVTVYGKCQKGLFHLRIGNFGRGMTDEQIASIGVFIQFEREKYEQQGMGLGLVIAQKAVELYGGELTISSVYHQEIAIHLTLPLVALEQKNNLAGLLDG